MTDGLADVQPPDGTPGPYLRGPGMSIRDGVVTHYRVRVVYRAVGRFTRAGTGVRYDLVSEVIPSPS